MCDNLITEGSGMTVEIDLIFILPLLIISALPTQTNTTALRTLHTFNGWKFWFSTSTGALILICTIDFFLVCIEAKVKMLQIPSVIK